nr:MAG TPA: hypothetical protein [Bacteriophage sp.]
MFHIRRFIFLRVRAYGFVSAFFFSLSSFIAAFQALTSSGVIRQQKVSKSTSNSTPSALQAATTQHHINMSNSSMLLASMSLTSFCRFLLNRSIAPIERRQGNSLPPTLIIVFFINKHKIKIRDSILAQLFRMYCSAARTGLQTISLFLYLAIVLQLHGVLGIIARLAVQIERGNDVLTLISASRLSGTLTSLTNIVACSDRSTTQHQVLQLVISRSTRIGVRTYQAVGRDSLRETLYVLLFPLRTCSLLGHTFTRLSRGGNLTTCTEGQCAIIHGEDKISTVQYIFHINTFYDNLLIDSPQGLPLTTHKLILPSNPYYIREASSLPRFLRYYNCFLTPFA